MLYQSDSDIVGQMRNKLCFLLHLSGNNVAICPFNAQKGQYTIEITTLRIFWNGEWQADKKLINAIGRRWDLIIKLLADTISCDGCVASCDIQLGCLVSRYLLYSAIF